MLDMIMGPNLFWFAIILVLIISSIKILPEWERAVVLRLGRCIGVKGPGVIVAIPGIDRLLRVDTRTVTLDVPPQDIITLDNVSLKVNAVIYFRVVDPEMAVTRIENYYFATSQLSQTTLRSVLGQYQTDDMLASRDKINHTLQSIIDKATETWGIKVLQVEMKQIDFTKEMQRAMAAQAEAERERRAKVISAEGELQRAEKLKAASNILAGSPSALQLAYLQSLNEIKGEGTHTVIFPLPMELLKPFMSGSYTDKGGTA